jgi:hypothetical protein
VIVSVAKHAKRSGVHFAFRCGHVVASAVERLAVPYTVALVIAGLVLGLLRGSAALNVCCTSRGSNFTPRNYNGLGAICCLRKKEWRSTPFAADLSVKLSRRSCWQTSTRCCSGSESGEADGSAEQGAEGSGANC